LQENSHHRKTGKIVMSTEHPLQHRWVLWEHKSVNNKSEEWANSMRIVCEFSSIEEFWTYWRFVPRPSEVLFDGSTRKGGQDAQFEMQKSTSDEATASLIGPLKATFRPTSYYVREMTFFFVLSSQS
jgi:Eukaryotic initiation factor 4E